jgi:predicted GH43/DUF377 family glycosyl hydrolase
MHWKNAVYSVTAFIFLLIKTLYCFEYDLDELERGIILETKKVDIPGYPFAFNPSIIQWKGRLLLSFRIIPDPKHSFHSHIGLAWLNEQLKVEGTPQILSLRDSSSPVPCRAEDGRLIAINDQLYLVYSDNCEKKISRGGFRVYIAFLKEKEGQFFVSHRECLNHFEGESYSRREKNWVPFSYRDQLLLSYSIDPHRILLPLLDGSGYCETLYLTSTTLPWKWGELRGGTPALLSEEGYLAFFHSVKQMRSQQSEGKEMPHYFIGAYTFSSFPPFSLQKISPSPLVARDFYSEPHYKPYWKPLRVVFPCGFCFYGEEILLAYGREDHEVWIARIDRLKLFQDLSNF